ncbi:B3 domain-containing protein Os01g0234100 isoform X2 [Rosa chinensis]|uniref:B3 domain-containing protein Os01g0234100 isoform X2 n=1 Tax=Rosa chinensis TaxID=74649 RepID=UPI000D0978CD|nr:B3 domain-containing protein Os01g0234100 isoform X2 [Rosa chinensis]
MAVVEEHKESSSCPQPKLEKVRQPKNEDKDKPFCQNSSRLKQMTKNNNNLANYGKQVVSAKPMKSDSHKPKTCKKAKVKSLYDTSKAQCSVLERANELAANLAPEFPSLVKVMMPSHVTRVFWLGIPRSFCREHMPKDDTMIVLEDENGEEYQTKYLVAKEGLSGGWRAFSAAHKLLEGDVLVFHKVMPSKLKVYIVRSTGSDEVDCSLGLIKFDHGIRRIKAKVTACESSKNGKLEPISVETLHENVQKENTTACNTMSGPISNQYQIDSEVLYSEVLDGIRLSESVIPFKEVSCIENFKVTVSGSIINAEISEHHLIKYYELCRSQNSFLHEHILERLNSSLVAGIISETVNLSDAIRACKITTSECDFWTWDRTLQASEMLGMNVGFLRARLDQLASLASKSKLCKEARLARDQAVKDMITLEAKLVRAREVINRLNFEIESLNTSSKKLEAMFKEVAKAPW